jgi:hypothetical protein
MRLAARRIGDRDIGEIVGPAGVSCARGTDSDRRGIGYTSAHSRSLNLLRQHLSAAQRAQYAKRKHFEVTGGETGRRYRITHGHQMNIDVFDEAGKRIHMLCFAPEGRLPIGDVMLAQKIALELFEREALAVANKSSLQQSGRFRLDSSW